MTDGTTQTSPRGDEARDWLTRTNLTPIRDVADFSGGYRVDGDGGVHAGEPGTPVAPVVRRSWRDKAEAHLLEAADLVGHHLLVLPDDVEPEEVEALVVTLWDGAGWADPGVLALLADATLRGPWGLGEELRDELRAAAPQLVARGTEPAVGWLLDCVPCRIGGGEMGAAAAVVPAAAARGVASVLDERAGSFVGGAPAGVEAAVLDALWRIARRFGGGVRIADTGRVWAPDPASAVHLSVVSPRWIDPDDLLHRLRPAFPGLIDSRDLPAPAPTAPAHPADLPDLPDEVRDRLAADIAAAARGPMRLDGYSLITPAGTSSRVSVDVRVASGRPAALRWEPWEGEVVIEYLVRWLPVGGPDTGAPTRSARAERERCARLVEDLAASIAPLVGGHVLDEDGFLVGLEAE